MSFTPRTTQPTDLSTWYGSYNAYNRFTSYNVGNCTWYAYGRTGEIAGENGTPNIYSDFRITAGDGSGKYWIYNTWPEYTYTSGSIDLQLGDILVYGSSDGYGHVEVVEAINATTITTSYSVYGDSWGDATYFNTRNISYPTWSSTMGTVINNNGVPHTYTNPFIGYIHNKYYTPGPEPPTPTLAPWLSATLRMRMKRMARAKIKRRYK